MNGPVTTGRLELNSSVLMSGDADRRCLGTIGVCIVVIRNGQSAAFRLTLNVDLSGASKLAMLLKRLRYGVLVLGSWIESNVNLASSAVNGWPSCQVTLGRRWNVHLRPSPDWSQLAARLGMGVPVFGSG